MTCQTGAFPMTPSNLHIHYCKPFKMQFLLSCSGASLASAANARSACDEAKSPAI